MGFFEFFIDRIDQIGTLFFQHIALTLTAVLIAILIGVPLGILISKYKKLSGPIIGVANIIQAVPSLALLGFLIPVIGIGSTPAVIMVLLYSLLPIMKNTYTGIININPDMIEAAKGMGMTKSQTLKRVQIPLALPVIMAGIRIAAVTAVGLMTIAAFIGAGGLGYMVFTGVQTVNNNMILAGAIPACILALIMDFIIGKIENAVVPEGIKNTRKKRVISKQTMKRLKPVFATFLFIIIISSVGLGMSKKADIVIGSKNYNEQILLGNIYAKLIEEKTDLNVKTQFNLGGSSVIFEAMKAGEVDMYVEYTGTSYVNIMNQKPITDAERVYNEVKDYYDKEFDVKWFKPVGFNNTYALAVNKELAKKYNLETYSDLARVSDRLKIGATMEFTEREDGYLGLKKYYNMKFPDIKAIDGGLRYTSLDNGEIDVIDAFSTEGLLKAFDLKVLEDDKNYFPPYYAVPIARNDMLEKYPELNDVLDILANKIDEDKMRELNYRVDKLGEDPKVVAEDFLREEGLI